MSKPVFRYDVDKMLWRIFADDPNARHGNFIESLRYNGITLSDEEARILTITKNAACMATIDYGRKVLNNRCGSIVCSVCPRWNPPCSTLVGSLMWLWEVADTTLNEKKSIASMMAIIPLSCHAQEYVIIDEKQND